MQKRVLIVDDEAVIVAGLAGLFELEELESAGAFDRATAEAMIEAAYYPVVIADLCLHSVEEGLALIDHIRQSSPTSRVMVLTAFASEATTADLHRRGVVAVLRKPTAGADIIAAVLALLAEMESEAAADDDRTLEELYVGARKRLFGISRRRFNLSPDAAEDVLQEAWLMFLERRGIVRTPGPWLSGTVANLARQHLDRNRRKRESPEETSGLAGMAMAQHDAEDILAVRQVLGRLDDRSRMLCQSIGLEGRSYEEVSAATGLPAGSIGPMYMRAKQKMREALSH
jgi:RNA polymerase sigma factor (sigma-70 family)